MENRVVGELRTSLSFSWTFNKNFEKLTVGLHWTLQLSILLFNVLNVIHIGQGKINTNHGNATDVTIVWTERILEYKEDQTTLLK